MSGKLKGFAVVTHPLTLASLRKALEKVAGKRNPRWSESYEVNSSEVVVRLVGALMWTSLLLERDQRPAGFGNRDFFRFHVTSRRHFRVHS